MRLGDKVIWNGRPYLLCGVDPMGVSGRKAHLEVIETAEQIRVPYEQVSEASLGTGPPEADGG
jgi:hypothetical protein